MTNDTHLFRLRQTLRDASRLTAEHCARFRQTAAENREMVAQSITSILDSKAALRRADEAMAKQPKAGPRAAWPGIPEALDHRPSIADNGLTSFGRQETKV